MTKKICILSLLLTAFSVCASAQASAWAAGPSTETKPRSSLDVELGVPVVEPISKRFRMNIPFDKAVYSKVSSANATAGHQYIWDNFSEGFIMLQYFEYPAGTIPRTPDGKKQWARERTLSRFVKSGVQTLDEKDITISNIPGMEYAAVFKGRLATIRVFANDDVYYALTFLAVPEDAGPTVGKLFDSFEFIKRREKTTRNVDVNQRRRQNRSGRRVLIKNV